MKNKIAKLFEEDNELSVKKIISNADTRGQLNIKSVIDIMLILVQEVDGWSEKITNIELDIENLKSKKS